MVRDMVHLRWGLIIQGPEYSTGLDGNREFVSDFDCLQNATTLSRAFAKEFSEILYVSTSSPKRIVIYRWQSDGFTKFCEDDYVINGTLSGQHPNLHLLLSSSHAGLKQLSNDIDIVVRMRSDIALNLVSLKYDFLQTLATVSNNRLYVLFSKSRVNSFAACDFLWCGFRNHLSLFLSTIIDSISNNGRLSHDKSFFPEKELSLHFLLRNRTTTTTSDAKYLLNYIPNSFVEKQTNKRFKQFLYTMLAPSIGFQHKIQTITFRYFVFANYQVIDSLVWRGAKYSTAKFTAVIPNGQNIDVGINPKLTLVDKLFWTGVYPLHKSNTKYLFFNMALNFFSIRKKLSLLLAKLLNWL